jgi:hypothetical protein
VLARLASEAGGRVVYSTLEKADLVAVGAEQAESEGLVDMLTQARDAEVAILFKEGPTARPGERQDGRAVTRTVLTRIRGGASPPPGPRSGRWSRPVKS